jgi:hypothetical protein
VPRVKMTPMAKFALYFLRIYLVVLLALVFIKFIFAYRTPVTH